MRGNFVRKDNEGRNLAIVKVQFPYDSLSFEGMIDTCITRTSEYWVYMHIGAKHLKISYPHHYPIDIKFKSWKIPALQQKSCYNLLLEKAPEEISKFYTENASFTLGTGFNVMSIMGPSANIGFDYQHFNVELGGIYGVNKSSDVYIYDKAGVLQDVYSYSAIRGFLRAGYELKVADIVSITPQVGAALTIAKGSQLSEIPSSANTVLDGGNAISATIGLRLMIAPFGHTARLQLTPEYDYAVSKDKNFEALSAFDFKIKSWADGLNVNLGLLFYF